MAIASKAPLPDFRRTVRAYDAPFVSVENLSENLPKNNVTSVQRTVTEDFSVDRVLIPITPNAEDQRAPFVPRDYVDTLC